MNPYSAAPIILYHKRRQRVERAKGLVHIVPAIVLLSALLDVVSGRESFTWLTALEVLVGAAYIVLLVRELLHIRRHGAVHHERIAWLELPAAGILALEGYHIWHRHHETALRTGQQQFHVLPWLYFGVAFWYLIMAFGMARLHERRFLHLHAAGFSGRLHLFKKGFDFTWPEVARLEPQGATEVLVHSADGQQKLLSFKNIHDGAAYRDRLLAHAQQQVAS
jgi:hypothetical protein